MAAISSNQRSHNHGSETTHRHHGPVVEELQGLIRVFKDGCVERPSIVPTVPCTASCDPARVTVCDVKLQNHLWTRVYVPVRHSGATTMPVVVYFHGGGFCVGSAAWSCYHEFLADLAVKAGAVIVSVNYRLSPENRLPAAYEDGFATVDWIKTQALRCYCHGEQQNRRWLSKCDLSRLFLAGDSAGGNIAYHVACRLITSGILVKPLNLRGVILIQPFFGGESRTPSEKTNTVNASSSALTLLDSDTYWRLALPTGVNRDYSWSNPLVCPAGLHALRLTPVLVCVSETDILKERNLEFCRALGNAGNKKVEVALFQGVGHAFQILYNSPMAHFRVQEMMLRLKGFINQ